MVNIYKFKYSDKTTHLIFYSRNAKCLTRAMWSTCYNNTIATHMKTSNKYVELIQREFSQILKKIVLKLFMVKTYSS